MPYRDPNKFREYLQIRQRKTASWIRKYKLEKGCKDCGYDTHHAALQFDHLPHFTKGRKISGSSNIATAMKEIKKCVVRCANCHSIKTWQRRQQRGQRILRNR